MTLLPKTCFFTGHRFIAAEDVGTIRKSLQKEILNAVNLGYTHFICGGAMGFDALAAEQIILMREDYDSIRLILYLPCSEHSKNWNDNDKLRFERILSLSDEVYYVSREPYKEGCMKKRNSAMVEASDLCIAYLKNLRSGTAQAVKMAENNGLKVINIAKKGDVKKV